MLKPKVLIIVGALFALVNGQTAKYSNEFLSLGVDARAMGMGNAVVSGVNDVTATYWNPAGLMKMEKKAQVGVMHAEYFAGIAKYDFGGFSTRLKDSSVFGLSFIRFGVDDIQNTLFLYGNSGTGIPDYDNITSFSVADYAFAVSYARNLGVENLDFGANVKVIHRNYGTFAKAWGFGLDFGAQYKYKAWDFGLMFRDVTSTFNAWSFNFTDEEKDILTITNNELPENGLEITLPSLNLGAGRTFDLPKSFKIRVETNWRFTFDGKRNVLIKSNPISIDPNLGTELSWKDLVYVRGGVGNFQTVKNFEGKESLNLQPNIGIGIRYRALWIDYAFTDIGNASVALYSHVFSLKFGINSAKENAKKP